MEKDIICYYIGLETGGTNINCVIASTPHNVISELHIPTGDPINTTNEVIKYIKSTVKQFHLSVKSMGIGSFGPVDLNEKSLTHGSITMTPKLTWRNFPLLKVFNSSFDFPIAFDTDVNAAALGEARWGAGIGLSDVIYVTVGTGIGGGIISNNQIVHGLIHPELGHMFIKHDTALDPFEGICPYHKDCLEGLANGPSIEARWGIPSKILPDDHPGWALEANYLAQMVINLTLMFSPQRIILGGGVSQHPGLISLVREKFSYQLNEYMKSPYYKEDLDSYIVPPKLGQNAGVFGAIALAQSLK
jgi:fructokinase